METLEIISCYERAMCEYNSLYGEFIALKHRYDKLCDALYEISNGAHRCEMSGGFIGLMAITVMKVNKKLPLLREGITQYTQHIERLVNRFKAYVNGNIYTKEWDSICYKYGNYLGTDLYKLINDKVDAKIPGRVGAPPVSRPVSGVAKPLLVVKARDDIKARVIDPHPTLFVPDTPDEIVYTYYEPYVAEVPKKTVIDEKDSKSHVKEASKKSEPVTGSYKMPVIDFYEYGIHKFPKSKRDKINFSKISDIAASECGVIDIDVKDDAKVESQQQKILSCDVLKTEKKYVTHTNDQLFEDKVSAITADVSNNQNILNLMDHLYQLYLNIASKTSFEDDETKGVAFKLWKKFGKNNIQMLLASLTSSVKKKADFKYDHSDKKTYIQKVTVNADIKCVIFGDLHGSFHTFFRHLLRLHVYGVIDMLTLIVDKQYNLFFLGDIVDRGQFSVEILCVVFYLLLRNNNVYYIRGNHEEIESNYNDGLLNELLTKFNTSVFFSTNKNHFCERGDKLNNNCGNKKHKDINSMPENEIKNMQYYEYFTRTITETKNNDIFKNVLQLYIDVNELFCSMPSAILLQIDLCNYWLCHGGIPNGEYKFDYGKDRDVISDKIGEQIRYNDFISSDNTIETVREYNNNLFGPFFAIGYNHTTDFLAKNNIKCIIRGHQDDIGNSYINKNLTEKIYTGENSVRVGDIEDSVISEAKIKSPGFFYNDMRAPSDNNKTNGPIARILADYNKIQYSSVVTISTCTDLERHLTADSFIVMHVMNDMKNMQNDFTVKLEKKRDIPNFNVGAFTGGKHDDYRKKYIKYKSKYFRNKS